MLKLAFISVVYFLNVSPERDSLGVETIDGRVFVIHKVDEKETLFSISKRYGATIDEVLQFNAHAARGLEIGQILKVPFTARKQRPDDAIVHKVGPKETLFSISQSYNVPIASLRQWNNLPDNALSVGQELIIRQKDASGQQPLPATSISKEGTHIVGQKETLFSIARQYNITVDQIKSWNNLQGNDLQIGQALVIAQAAPRRDPVVQEAREQQPRVEQATQTPVVTTTETSSRPVEENATIRISESVSSSDEIVETGIAELIEGTEGNRKYLALHRTAPVGTILKVRNEMNNREVFVRVMGKLPDTAMTDKLIIRISRSAYDRLGAIDTRFRVALTYYK